MDMVHVRISAQQRGPFRVDHPGDFRARMRLPDRRDRRQRVDNVAERARFDDQYGANVGFQWDDK